MANTTRLGGARVDIVGNDTKMVSALERAEARWKRFGGTVDRNRKSAQQLTKSFSALRLGVIGLGTTLASAGVLQGFRRIATEAANLQETADNVGLLATELEAIRALFEQDGLSIGETDKLLLALNRRLGVAAMRGGNVRDAFKELGVDAEALAGTNYSLRDVLVTVGERLGSMEDKARAGALAMELFSEQGRRLVGVFGKFPSGLDDVIRKLDEQTKASDKHIKSLKGVDGEFTKLSRSIKDMFTVFAGENADKIKSVVQSILWLTEGLLSFHGRLPDVSAEMNLKEANKELEWYWKLWSQIKGTVTRPSIAPELDFGSARSEARNLGMLDRSVGGTGAALGGMRAWQLGAMAAPGLGFWAGAGKLALSGLGAIGGHNILRNAQDRFFGKDLEGMGSEIINTFETIEAKIRASGGEVFDKLAERLGVSRDEIEQNFALLKRDVIDFEQWAKGSSLTDLEAFNKLFGSTLSALENAKGAGLEGRMTNRLREFGSILGILHGRQMNAGLYKLDIPKPVAAAPAEPTPEDLRQQRIDVEARKALLENIVGIRKRERHAIEATVSSMGNLQAVEQRRANQQITGWLLAKRHISEYSDGLKEVIELEKQLSYWQDKGHHDLMKSIDETLEFSRQLGTAIKDSIKAPLTDIIFATKDLKEAFRDLLRTFFDAVQHQLVSYGVDALFGILTNKASGTGTGTPPPPPPGNAGGGSVYEGHPYMVGEKGRELFIPGANGTIVDHMTSEKLMGGGGPTVNINIDTMVKEIKSVDGPGVVKGLMTAEPIIEDRIVNRVVKAIGKTGPMRTAALGGGA